ncbi:MAG: segregation ATPase FtsK/SpoIIIE, family [Mycobacteriales bacterium]
MSTVVFRRPARRPAPEVSREEIQLQEPPTLPEAQGGGVSALVTYLPMAAGSSVMVLLFVQPGAQVVTYLAAGLMGVSTLGMMVGQMGRTAGDRKRRLKGERRDYLRYLTQMRRQVRRVADQQSESLFWLHPHPGGLWSVAMSARLWERRPAHDDFGEVRIGLGEQRLAARIRPPQTKPVEDLEPLCASALRRFVRAYTTVSNLPTSLFLRAFARVLCQGDPDAVRGMARAALAQLVTFHSPDDLRIAVCAGTERQADWDWVKWLPHALHPTETDGAGPTRLISDNYRELERMLGTEFSERPRFEPGAVPKKDEPYVVVVLDGVQVPIGARIAEAGLRNVVVLDVSGALRWKADRLALRLRVAADTIESVGADRTGKDTFVTVGRPDSLSLVRCRALARLVAPYRMGLSVESAEPLASDIELTSLLGAGDPRTFDPTALWAARSPWDRLNVPIGVAEDGNPVLLDIKESAQGGMGPHGMLIGATGSGKSELLRTLVLGLALTHSSEVLNFVLTDFKGGATFIGMERLPHTSAVITNLADELPLVDRMQDALHGELVRRQETLRRAGYASLRDYEQARAAGTTLEPLPTLFVIVDEFSELLSQKREFLDLFVMIGRLGRSLGVHLLLASQRLDEGRISQLESHLSYRIGLKTFSATESRAVLGVPDAYELPPSPGNGYLKTDTTTLIRFKAAYVSGSYASRKERHPAQTLVAQQIVPYQAGYLAPRAPLEPDLSEVDVESSEVDESTVEPAHSETLLSLLLDRLEGAGPPAHQVWLPPLAEPPSLDQVIPPLAPDPELGLCPADWPGRGGLSVPVGIVDRPFEGVRDLLLAELAGGAGHVGIVGAPQSGKSTMVRTLISSLALTHTPREVQFYCLDFGGGGLSGLGGLPHVGSVASRLDRDRVTRTIAELGGLLLRREQQFAQHGVESMAAYRRARRDGKFADDPFGDVFLVIDGWFTLRQDFDTLESSISDLANRGLNYGIHIVISATRWSEIRPWLRDLISTRFELHLGDPVESEIGTRAAANVPAVPGRGLTTDPLHFLSALPRVDGEWGTEDLPDATRALVEAVAEAWPGEPAPAVRLLPTTLAVAELPPVEGDMRVALGWDEQALQPVWHDFDQTPHLMVFGDSETGKTNLLRLVAQAVSARYKPAEARILLADYRRDLYPSIPPDMLLSYAVTSSAFDEILQETSEALRVRLPGTDITPDRLRLRDWWKGPRLYILVDDYDLVSSGTRGPLEPLVELLPQGADIGMHLIVARSSSGASRAMMDPALRRMWELGTPGVLFSYPREEGGFLGDAKPRTLPPGRAQYVTRRRTTLVQTGLVNPPPTT